MKKKPVDKIEELERVIDKAERWNRKTENIFKIIVLLLLFVALGVAIWGICIDKSEKAGNYSKAQGGVLADVVTAKEQTGKPVENPLSGRNIYFSGIQDAVIARDGVVRLDNREDNRDFLLKYMVYDAEDGSLLHETGLIRSGESEEWSPGVSLQAGEYTLTYLEIPYYEDETGEYITLTKGSCQAKLRIRDKE